MRFFRALAESASLTMQAKFFSAAQRGIVLEERGRAVGAKEVRQSERGICRINAAFGKVETSSPTHDQCFGGPERQRLSRFCIFPADPSFRTAITRDAAKVGIFFARTPGVVIVPFPRSIRSKHACLRPRAFNGQPTRIEIIFAKVEHAFPFLTLQFLKLAACTTPRNRATFVRANGHKNFLVASDLPESPR